MNSFIFKIHLFIILYLDAALLPARIISKFLKLLPDEGSSFDTLLNIFIFLSKFLALSLPILLIFKVIEILNRINGKKINKKHWPYAYASSLVFIGVADLILISQFTQDSMSMGSAGSMNAILVMFFIFPIQDHIFIFLGVGYLAFDMIKRVYKKSYF